MKKVNFSLNTFFENLKFFKATKIIQYPPLKDPLLPQTKIFIPLIKKILFYYATGLEVTILQYNFTKV